MHRTFVAFQAETPDDSTWDEDGTLTTPGGFAIAEIVREAMIARGVECTSVCQQGFYGWSYDVTINGASFVFVIQDVDPWLITLDPRASFLKKLRGYKSDEETKTALSMLYDILNSNPHFNELKWFTREEYEQGSTEGTNRPVG